MPFHNSCTTAGKDATEAFFGLHRYEVLERPQYKRLRIGTVVGQEQLIFPQAAGELSKVPYAEPTWLTPGYFSPYFKDVRAFNLVLPLDVLNLHWLPH